jgi:hypothetical protein
VSKRYRLSAITLAAIPLGTVSFSFVSFVSFSFISFSFGTLFSITLFAATLFGHSIECAQAQSTQIKNAQPLRPERGIITLDSKDPEEDKREILFQPSVAKYRSLLLAPMASWIEADLFRARVFSALEFDWSYGSKWQESSKENLTQVGLSSDESSAGSPASKAPTSNSSPSESALLKPEAVSFGFPFGNAEDIDREGDPVKRAEKILWNVSSVQKTSPAIGIDARIAWIGAQSLLREGRAFLFRSANETIIPQVYKGPEANTIHGYELFRFVGPAAISGYTTATLRFASPQEDKLIHYSPVIDSRRHLLSSHRGDNIIEGLLSLDDLFVFNQRVDSVKARVVAEKTMLIPYPSLVPEVPSRMPELFPELASEEREVASDEYDSVGGKHQLKSGRSTSVLWNHDVAAFKQHAPWLPLTMYLVPRNVWIIELFPRDPYHPYGKQILVVEKESMLPFYKIVHDSSGEIEKTIVAAWGYVSTGAGDESAGTVFPSFLFAVDRGARSATTMSIHRVQIYSESPTKNNSSLASLLTIPERALSDSE